MSRKQQQGRTSGNTKRASSERTATLLSAGGTIPHLNAFFPSLSVVSTNENDVENTVDRDFRLSLKKFYKKDAITKLKALEEFTSLVENKPEENLLGLLPFWPRHFNRLGMDIDRRVRESTYNSHSRLCLKLGKQIAPFLKNILPTWIVGRFDTYGPAASEAERGFNEVFPVDKHRKVMALYMSDIMEQFRRNLFSLSAETVPDCQDLTKEEKDMKLLAIQCGTLQGLRFVIETVMDGEEVDERKMSPCVELVNDPGIWHLAQHNEATVQRIFYELLSTALKKNMVRDLKKATSITLGRLAGNKDSLTCSAIWQAVIHLVSSHPDCWDYVDMRKQVLPQLLLVIKERGFGIAQNIFSAVLPFFSMMPDKAEYRFEVLQGFRYCITENSTVATSVVELAVALLPLLRNIVTTKDPVTARVQSVAFRETHSLLCYFREKSVSCDKYSITDSIYHEIYTMMMQELDSGYHKACVSLHAHLNSSPEKIKSKKTLCFASDSDAKQSQRESTFVENEDLLELNLIFLCRVLTLCNTGPSSELFKVLGDIFPLYYNSNSIDSFRKNGFHEDRILGDMKLWLTQKSSAGAIAKILLTLASLEPSVPEGAMYIVQLCEETPQFLLTILDHASECFSSINLRPVLVELYHIKSFTESIVVELEGPRKWNIITSCFSSPSLFSETLADHLISFLLEDMEVVLARRRHSRDKIKLCETISRIFALDKNAWSRPLIPTLVFRIYQFSTQPIPDSDELAHEFREIASHLRTIWLTALESQNEYSRNCRLQILDDLKQSLTDPPSPDMDFVVECVVSLTADEEASLSTLQRLIPTSDQFEEIMANWCTNELVRKREYGLLILDTVDDLSEQKDYNKLFITYEALLKIMEERNAVQLLDITHLILLNLIKPQPRFKSVITALLSSEEILENTVKLLCQRKGIHWAMALESLLSSTEYRVTKEVWQANECTAPAKQICVKQSDDVEELWNSLTDMLDKLKTSPDTVDPEKICFAISCIRNGSDEHTSSSLEQLVTLLESLHDSQPEQFEAFRVNSLHLATCFTCLAIIEESALDRASMSNETWSRTLKLLTKMLEKFLWRHAECKSKMTLATGIVVCDVAFKFHKQICTENYELDDSVKSRFFNTLIEALVPELPTETEKLWEMPDAALESVAQVYATLDSKLVNKFWKSKKRSVVSTVESIMSHLCEKMQSKRLAVQMTAYVLATIAVKRIIRERELQYCKEKDIREPLSIHPVLYGFLEDMCSGLSILKSIYGGLHAWKIYSQDDSCIISTYILAMSTILDFCTNSSPEERSAYIDFVEEDGQWTKYLDLLFEFVPDEAPPTAFGSHPLPRRFDFTHIVCWALVQISERASGILKSWYAKLNDSKLENRVRSLMTRYVSPILIARELSHAQSGLSQSPEWSLISISSTREIIARYMLEDIGKTLEICVQMEPCHPLKPLRISYDPDKVVGSKIIFQQWVHQLNLYLHSFQGSAVEALNAWKGNLHRKLEGTAECSVCYGVLHASTLRLPDYPCKTCKHRFHKACMYKWFRQGRSTCPLCRSVLG